MLEYFYILVYFENFAYHYINNSQNKKLFKN